MDLDRRQKLFLFLCCLFVTALVVGDIIGGKLIEIHLAGLPFVMSVGSIPFPVTFLLTDVLNEFYGPKATRTITWIGFGMAIFTLMMVRISVGLPWPEFTRAPGWQGVTEGAFNNVFAGSTRILLASMVAYLAAQFLDIAVFHALKRLSANRYLWLRATGSTVASQLIDTVVIQALAWYGILSGHQIGVLVVSSYVVKLAIAIGLTPLVYGAHVILEKKLGIHPVKLGVTTSISS